MPTDDIQTSLADFLSGNVPVPETVVVVAEDPLAPQPPIVPESVEAPGTPVSGIVAAVPTPDEEMRNLMGLVKRIGMCAKDLHYRAKGKPFYGLHQLADLSYDVEKDTDQIAEIYFMGDRGIEPPRMDEVYKIAIDAPVLYPRNENYFIGGLMDACRLAMNAIEAIKKAYEVKSGVAAVLDAISEHCLLSIGLLDQTMKH